jgi:hypothetical protein
VLTPEQSAEQIDQCDFRFNPDAGGILDMGTLATTGLAADPEASAMTHAIDLEAIAPSELAAQLAGQALALSLLGAPGTPGRLEIAEALGTQATIDLLMLDLPEPRAGEVFVAAPTYLLHRRGAPEDVLASFSLRLTCLREGQDLCLFVDPLHALGPDGPQGEAVAAVLGLAAAAAAGQLLSTCLFDAAAHWNLLYFLPEITPPGLDVSDEDAFPDRVALAFVDAFPDLAITETECEQARVDIQELDPNEPAFWVEHLQSRAAVTVFVAGRPMTRPDTNGAFRALQQRLPRLADLAA